MDLTIVALESEIGRKMKEVEEFLWDTETKSSLHIINDFFKKKINQEILIYISFEKDNKNVSAEITVFPPEDHYFTKTEKELSLIPWDPVEIADPLTFLESRFSLDTYPGGKGFIFKKNL